jgi:hypothetical protein
MIPRHGGIVSTPGWYPDPAGVGQRYYDGAEWTGDRQLTIQDRTVILQQTLVERVGTNCRVVAQSPTSATVVQGAETNQVMHVLLTIFTCGVWLPFWILFAATGQPKRHIVTVDEQGRVIWRP